MTPPFLLLPYPAKIGTKWNGEFTVKNDANKHTYRGEIQPKVVDVAAGKFKCVKVNIELEENGQTIKTRLLVHPRRRLRQANL